MLPDSSPWQVRLKLSGILPKAQHHVFAKKTSKGGEAILRAASLQGVFSGCQVALAKPNS